MSHYRSRKRFHAILPSIGDTPKPNTPEGNQASLKDYAQDITHFTRTYDFLMEMDDDEGMYDAGLEDLLVGLEYIREEIDDLRALLDLPNIDWNTWDYNQDVWVWKNPLAETQVVTTMGAGVSLLDEEGIINSGEGGGPYEVL